MFFTFEEISSAKHSWPPWEQHFFQSNKLMEEPLGLGLDGLGKLPGRPLLSPSFRGAFANFSPEFLAVGHGK